VPRLRNDDSSWDRHFRSQSDDAFTQSRPFIPEVEYQRNLVSPYPAGEGTTVKGQAGNGNVRRRS